MIRGDVMRKGVSSLLMIVLTTLTVALSGCSSDKAGDSESVSESTATGTDTQSQTAETVTETQDLSAADTTDDLSRLIVGIPQDIETSGDV